MKIDNPDDKRPPLEVAIQKIINRNLLPGWSLTTEVNDKLVKELADFVVATKLHKIIKEETNDG